MKPKLRKFRAPRARHSPTEDGPRLFEAEAEADGPPPRQTVPVWIVVCAFLQGGGAGRTTVAVHLAAEYLRRNQRVCVFDAAPDCTGSATDWRLNGAERGHLLPNVFSYWDEDDDDKRFSRTHRAATYEIIIVDGEPRNDLVEELQALIDNLPPGHVPHLVVLRHPATESAADAAVEVLLNLDRNRPAVSRVVVAPDHDDYATAMAEGRTLTEMDRHPNALLEIRAIADAIDQLRAAKRRREAVLRDDAMDDVLAHLLEADPSIQIVDAKRAHVTSSRPLMPDQWTTASDGVRLQTLERMLQVAETMLDRFHGVAQRLSRFVPVVEQLRNSCRQLIEAFASAAELPEHDPVRVYVAQGSAAIFEVETYLGQFWEASDLALPSAALAQLVAVTEALSRRVMAIS